MYFLRAHQGIKVTTSTSTDQQYYCGCRVSFNLLQIKQSKVLITNAKQKQSRTKAHNQCTDKINSEKQRAPFLLPSPAHREPGHEATFLSIEPLYLKRSSTDFCWSKIVIIFAKTSIITAGQRKGPDESIIHTTYYTPAIHVHKPNPHSCR